MSKGKKSQKKGFISGLILGIIFVVFLILISLFINSNWTLGSFIYYSILIITSMLGSILGINKKKSN